MTDTFVLKIELANAAMQTPYDVSQALIDLAARLHSEFGFGGYAGIKDANGNVVGSWEVQ